MLLKVREFILQFEPCSCMQEVYYVRKERGSGKYGDPVQTLGGWTAGIFAQLVLILVPI
jgi:hypothetical protein